MVIDELEAFFSSLEFVYDHRHTQLLQAEAEYSGVYFYKEEREHR